MRYALRKHILIQKVSILLLCTRKCVCCYLLIFLFSLHHSCMFTYSLALSFSIESNENIVAFFFRCWQGRKIKKKYSYDICICLSLRQKCWKFMSFMICLKYWLNKYCVCISFSNLCHYFTVLHIYIHDFFLYSLFKLFKILFFFSLINSHSPKNNTTRFLCARDKHGICLHV